MYTRQACPEGVIGWIECLVELDYRTWWYPHIVYRQQLSSTVFWWVYSNRVPVELPGPHLSEQTVAWSFQENRENNIVFRLDSVFLCSVGAALEAKQAVLSASLSL